MITYDQIPFIRQTAKKFLQEGKIDHKRYDEIMSLLAEVENDKVTYDEKVISEARKNIARQRMLAFS